MRTNCTSSKDHRNAWNPEPYQFQGEKSPSTNPPEEMPKMVLMFIPSPEPIVVAAASVA